MVWLEPPVGRTVSVAPLTAVTTPRTLAKSKPKPPEGRGAKLKSRAGRPGSRPDCRPQTQVAAQAPLTAGETVTEVADGHAAWRPLPVAVTQLPTAMSARLPVLGLADRVSSC
jgi:hypothetical protein